MDSMMLTYPWLKLIDMPLFTMCVGICGYTYTYISFQFRRIKSYTYIDVPGVGRCCLLLYMYTHTHADTIIYSFVLTSP
jgi:hypothetical protein